MSQFTVGVFGQLDNDFLKRLGNKGTINDIEFRNHSSERDLITYCSPKSEKVTSLMQIMGLIDFPVLVFDKPSATLGEAILAVDAHGFDLGVICVSGEFGDERAQALVNGTCLECFDMIPMDPNTFKEHITSEEFLARLHRPEGPTKVPIDNYFVVKSVGTVILGVVKRGELGVYTKMSLYPEQREVLIKSIQSHDRDVRNATTLQRVGLSLKGVKADELKRGYIIAQKDSLNVASSITVSLRRNKVLKEDIREGDAFFACVGLQCPVGRVTNVEGDRISLELERPIAFDDSDRAILALTTPKPPRIVGGGPLAM
ncbi:MAG TPA: hypothetical protein PK718_01475 [Candidatus Methanofastidiosa archaeon]|nr:hypothetical protein [Candidatus Methanofastidiosa archaeon]HPR41202.1 hypothetical protein [Candidatus Methanofastidiosa archaeon]